MGNSITKAKKSEPRVAEPGKGPELVRTRPGNRHVIDDISNFISFLEEDSSERYSFPNCRRHLVVDDAKTNRMVIKRYLAEHGIDCDEAANGLECIKFIEEGNSYDVIWMDQVMPFKKGTETTDRLRMNGHRNVIILLTGCVDTLSINEMRQSDINGILGKPVFYKMFGQVLDRIDRVFAKC